jgi:hypothetical protein
VDTLKHTLSVLSRGPCRPKKTLIYLYFFLSFFLSFFLFGGTSSSLNSKFYFLMILAISFRMSSMPSTFHLSYNFVFCIPISFFQTLYLHRYQHIGYHKHKLSISPVRPIHSFLMLFRWIYPVHSHQKLYINSFYLCNPKWDSRHNDSIDKATKSTDRR